MAPDQVVVDDPDRLHEGVDGRRAHERPTPSLEVFSHGGSLADHAEPDQLPPVRQPGSEPHNWLERPDVVGKTLELVFELEAPAGVVDGRLDLRSVADDAGIAQKPLDPTGVEPRDRGDVESLESPTKALPLAEEGEPAQAGLKSFQGDDLKQAPVVSNGSSPFEIVVSPIEGIVGAPPAARDAVGAGDHAGLPWTSQVAQHYSWYGRPVAPPQFGVFWEALS